MNCQSFIEIVSELARDRSPDQLETHVRALALAHLQDCSECSQRLQDERSLTRGLREVAIEMKTLAAPGRIEEQLRASFRNELRGLEIREQRSEDRRQRAEVSGYQIGVSGRWMLAAAAIVLLVVGLGGWRRYAALQSRPTTAGSEKVLVENSPGVAPLSAGARDNGKPDKQMETAPATFISKKDSQRRHRRFNRVANANRQVVAKAIVPTTNDLESEVSTYFMPLGYTGPINPQDGGQLVRVELPRSAMLSMGLPVNMDRYGERVKADVLLGPDGLARAIRFVQ